MAEGADRWRLEASEVPALRALQVRMMHAEVVAERREKLSAQRSEQLAAVVAALVSGGNVAGAGEPGDPARDLVRILADAPGLAAEFTERDRAVILLANLLVFDPWTGRVGWTQKVHRAASAEVAALLPGLRPDDYDAMRRELDAVLKQLRRKSIRWGRLAVVTVVGLGVGVATGGVAAPAIGAVVGSSLLGLSGAAATSAGLAALGGGSLAAGGFGMAGGAALVTGVGGLAGAGVAGAGARLSGLAYANVASAAIELGLIARILLVEDADRDQKMRRVVESLHHAQNDLAGKVGALSARIAELKNSNAELDQENNRLKSVVRRLRTELVDARSELTELRAELERSEQAAAAVEIVLDRLPDPDAPSDGAIDPDVDPDRSARETNPR
ncbi:hypothetical protein [Nocardia sp. NPDC050710]|uniref:hypothetical protein n=1 Tax=Nocardia sp. NPDC050710 TaxID=3157220 RepID=UPI0033DA5B92